MTIFPWLFVSCLLIYFAKRHWILLIGLIDLGLGITVAVGLAMQAEYLPAADKECTLAKAEAWQVVGNYDSFFVLTSKLGKGKNASAACKYYTHAWGLAIATLVFQMLISYIGIFFDEREASLLNPCRPLIYVCMIILGPPVWLWDHAVPRIRFSYSYLIKFIRRARGAKKLNFVEQQPYVNRDEHIPVMNPDLQQIFNIEHILLNVVVHMHYEDVINLSMTSKAIRDAIYPSRDLKHRIPKLKKHCCRKESKKACLYCNKKICDDCQIEHLYPGLAGRRHVTTCQPYCSKCYYTQFSRHPRGYKPPCKCRQNDRALELQLMCRTCGKRDTQEMQTTRHRRYIQEARDIANGKFLKPGKKTRCGGCKKELESGTRFWVCGKCKGECRDTIHPSYVVKKKDVDIEMGEKSKELNRERWRWRWLFGLGGR
jgi:hypothetical protein